MLALEELKALFGAGVGGGWGESWKKPDHELTCRSSCKMFDMY